MGLAAAVARKDCCLLVLAIFPSTPKVRSPYAQIATGVIVGVIQSRYSRVLLSQSNHLSRQG